MSDASERLAYLADNIDLLWPGTGAPGDDRTMTVVPSIKTPRLLVPVRPRRAAAAAILRYTAQQTPRQRAAGVVLAMAARAGWCGRLPVVRSEAPSDESIDDYLAGVLGRPVRTALALTHERPNRKPVLQVFDSDGRTIAFVKIGVSALAASLVDAEAEALAALAPRCGLHVRVPEKLHRGTWHGMPVLVSSPMPSGRAPHEADPALAEAMHEVSVAVRGSLAEYVESLRARADKVGSAASPWRDLFDEVVERRDLDRIPAGSWHGDWTQWNCARAGSQVLVWDWERFTRPAPVGFDMLHFVLNSHVRGRRDHFAPVAAGLVTEAPSLLARWGLADLDARTVALLYLLDIALRYITDDLRSTDPGGRVEQWAFPIVRAQLASDAARLGRSANPSTTPRPMSPEL